MKSFLKKIYSSITSLFESFISILCVLFFSRYRRKGLTYYMKRNNNKELISVLGNGPSLANSIEKNIAQIKSSELMVVNTFYESSLLLSLKPKYYIAIDPAFFREGVAYADNRTIKGFVSFLNQVDWEIFVLVPFEFFNSFTFKQIHNDSVTFIYINRTPIHGFTSLCHLLYRRNCGMPTPMNVLNAAVFCSINLGFKNINLYGADHSWLKDVRVNSLNETCMRDGHFYDDENHLRVVKGYDITKLLQHFATMFKSHKLLQQYAISRKVCILNCTPGSFIDAYPRKTDIK